MNEKWRDLSLQNYIELCQLFKQPAPAKQEILFMHIQVHKKISINLGTFFQKHAF